MGYEILVHDCVEVIALVYSVLKRHRLSDSDYVCTEDCTYLLYCTFTTSCLLVLFV
jgi:hypothetical protein